jgi:ligand-binding sensor domain-containing protein/signal transduction histidine kinase
VLFSSPALAIDPNRLISQYIRERWGSEKGFMGGPVTAIAQTTDGYLWIGTVKGLIRFDGLSFRLFQQAIPTSYPLGSVQDLVADSQGNLWVLLQNTKILRYHGGKFELGRDEAEVGITSVGKRKDGTPLFSSLALGTLKYDSGKFETIFSNSRSASSNSATAAITDELSSRLSWATGVAPHRFAEPNSAVVSMAETADGKIWLGTRDKGLFYIKEGQIVSAGKGLPTDKINCLLAIDNRELWIGTDKGVVRWNGTAITSEGVPFSVRHTQVNSMVRDRDANIWLGTSAGLVRLNAKGASVDGPNSRANERVTALFEDREGNLWVGSQYGIERLRDSAFVTYSTGGLQSESSGPVFVDGDERVWFAPFEGGLHWLDGGKSGSVEIERLGQDVVYSIAGSKGELWIGRQQGGLTHLVYDTGRMRSQSYTEENGLAQNSVYAVHQSRDGTVWAGTLSGGVSEFRNSRFTTYTTANGLSSNTVNSIADTPDGTIWIATPNGISALSKGKWQTFGISHGLPSAIVNCLLSDSSGILWVGTSSGITLIRSGRVDPPAELPPSLREQILGIAEDRKGWLWISTPNHVLRVNRDKLLSGNSPSETDVREYGLEDGLHGVEGVKRHRSVFRDPLGKIWFSMNRGLSVVDPERAIASSAPAIVHVEDISADGNPVGLQTPIRLPGIRRRITFSYAGLSLSVPERVRFKYKLEGLDEAWSNPVTARDVTYNNLSSGTYRFRVVAGNSDGLWNSEESVVPFEIEPAYWQSWWFRVSAVVTSALAILLFVRLRLRKLAAQMNIRFEERLAERTRIAQELHDTLLQGFLSASMQLHVADERLPEESPAKPMVRRVLQLMTRVIDEGRNTVRGLRSYNGTQKNLEVAFSELQHELASSGHSTFRVIVEGAPRQLRAVSRDEIYFIGREALVNAFRHSGATEIAMEIEYAVNHLRILVRDNGCGIDPQVLNSGREGHWGLSGMRERADRIGVRLRVLSRADAGTEVELSVPSRIAFEPETAKSAKLWFSKLYSRKVQNEKSESESVHRH